MMNINKLSFTIVGLVFSLTGSPCGPWWGSASGSSMFLFFAFPLTREALAKNNPASHNCGIIYSVLKVYTTSLLTTHGFYADDVVIVVTCWCVCVLKCRAGDGSSSAPSMRDWLRDRVSLFTVTECLYSWWIGFIANLWSKYCISLFLRTKDYFDWIFTSVLLLLYVWHIRL